MPKYEEDRNKAKEHGISVLHLVRESGLTLQQVRGHFLGKGELSVSQENKLDIELNKLVEKRPQRERPTTP